MRCPNCGEQIRPGGKKCARCGYMPKSVVPVEKWEETDGEAENAPPRTHETDAKRVHAHASAGGDFFDDLFGNLFGDFLGGVFGSGDESDGYDDDPQNYDDFGERISRPDEFSRDCVEIREVEYLKEPDKEPDKKSRHRLFKKDDGAGKDGFR